MQERTTIRRTPRGGLVGALALAAALAGCGDLTGNAEYTGLDERAHAFRVEVYDVEGDGLGVELIAEVNAPGAEWAALRGGRVGSELGLWGPTRRLENGRGTLERHPEWLRPSECVGGVCTMDFVVELDGPPREPWSVEFTAIGVGDRGDGAVITFGRIPLPE